MPTCRREPAEDEDDGEDFRSVPDPPLERQCLSQRN